MAPVTRLLAEATHLRPLEDQQLDALRRALLVEDVLGLQLTDEEIDGALLSDPEAVAALLPRTHRTF